ncbi:MAG: hypothetical protein OEY56_13150 [Cyclobacteriaceae bacterium]|nr:hypothetical protein [Cyclobacteriaceae bacterium]
MKTLKKHLALIAFLSTFSLYAQSQLQHEKKHFLSEDGKLYWQAQKPVYLFVSENPTGTEAKRLESNSTPEYANPFFFDTEGVNYVRTRWAVDPETRKPIEPQMEVMFEVYRDGIAPTSQVDFLSAQKYSDGTTLFYGQGLSLSSSATDYLSGINNIYFSANKNEYAAYNESIPITTDGSYLYQFYAVDNVGNVEMPQSFSFTVDVTAPVSSLSVEGESISDILSPRTKLLLSANDASSGLKSIHYKMDGQNDQLFDENISLKNLEEGVHSVTYYSIDNVGNREADKTFDFYLDRTQPEVLVTVEGDKYEIGSKIFVSGRTMIKLSSTDNKAGLKSISYQIDKNGEVMYTESFPMPQGNGDHSVTFYAVDNVGNSYKSLYKPEGLGKSQYLTDMDAPIINHSYAGLKYFTRDTMFVTSQSLIELHASDVLSGVKEIQYRINGGDYKTYKEPFSIDKEGTFLVEYFGTDNVQNKADKSFVFRVDNSGPNVEKILSMEPVGTLKLDEKGENLDVHTKGVKLYLAATDEIIDTETVYYQINGGTEKIYTSPINLTMTGIVSFSIRAIDKLGNETKTDPIEIFVK